MNDAGARAPLRLLLTAAALILLLLFVYHVAELLLLLFLAVLLSIYLGGVTDWFQRRLRIPRPLGIAISVVASLVVFGGIGVLLIPHLTRQAAELFTALPQQLLQWERSLSEFLVENPALGGLVGPVQEGQSYFSTLLGEIGQYFREVFPYLFTGFWFFIHAVSVLAMAIYLTAKPALYRAEVVTLVPPASRDLALDIMRELGATLRAWIGGQLLAMIVLGLLTWLGLQILQVPFALAFGVLTGLVAIVPFFGTLVSTLLPAIFVLAGGGVLYALLVAGVGVVVHLIEANWVAPKIFERQVELPPVWTLLSVLVAFKLLGPIGLIVAVPILAVGRVLVRRLYVERVLEGGSFQPIVSDEPVVIRLPSEGVSIRPEGSGLSVPALLEETPG